MLAGALGRDSMLVSGEYSKSSAVDADEHVDAPDEMDAVQCIA